MTAPLPLFRRDLCRQHVQPQRCTLVETGKIGKEEAQATWVTT